MAPSIGSGGGGTGSGGRGSGRTSTAFGAGSMGGSGRGSAAHVASSLPQLPYATAAPPPSLLRHRSVVGVNSTTCLASSAAASIDMRGGGSSAVGTFATMEGGAAVARKSRSEDPNLFDIPSDLNPIYRPLPLWTKALIGFGSAVLAAGRKATAEFFTSLATADRASSFTVRRFAVFAMRTLILAWVSKMAVEEVWFAPSRVTTGYLKERGELPSTLSEYEVVVPSDLDGGSGGTGVNGSRGSSGGGAVSSVSVRQWDESDDVSSFSPVPIGVHYIRCFASKNKAAPSADTTQGNSRKWYNYDGIHLHHGFGASSLSYLPLLPRLAGQLGARTGVAHDAPGFGFTDRPDADDVENAGGGLRQYGYENSAAIGLRLLEDSMDLAAPEATAVEEKEDNNNGATTVDGVDENGVEGSSGREGGVALFGHSMGAKSALRLALAVSSRQNKGRDSPQKLLVVLLAPALPGVTMGGTRDGGGGTVAAAGSGVDNRRSDTSKATGLVGVFKRSVRSLLAVGRKFFFDYPFTYLLRRLVCGNKEFWRKGLAVAWGDPNALADDGVLRYQWPSIGLGWERGLVSFSRAKIFGTPSSRPEYDDDRRLLQDVLDLPNTRVILMYGSKDRVVGIEGAVAESLKREFPTVELVRLEGQGHNPFEEDVDGFLMDLDKVLRKDGGAS